MTKYDVAVIGGGVAGSAAALLLARAGRQVVLLEKEPAAHHKVCGEFLSFEAQHYLKELRLDLVALGAMPIKHLRLIAGHHSADCPLPFSGLSLSRKRLDEQLLLMAECEGVEVRRGHSVSSFVPLAAKWHLKITDNKENVIADTVFLASGKHDVPGQPRGKGTQNDYIGFKMHFALTTRQMAALEAYVEIIFFSGGYAGLQPIEDGKANLCLVVEQDFYKRHGKRWNLLLDILTKATPLLADRLRDAVPCWPQPLAIFKIPYGFVYHETNPATEGLYRLGDQMAVIPSFCGDGTSIALYTAFHAVESYIKTNATTYHEKTRKMLLPQIRLASVLASVTSYSCTQILLILMGKISPNIISAIALRTRLRMPLS